MLLRACLYEAGWPISQLARQQTSPGLYDVFDCEAAMSQPGYWQPHDVILLREIERTRKHILVLSILNEKRMCAGLTHGKVVIISRKIKLSL